MSGKWPLEDVIHEMTRDPNRLKGFNLHPTTGVHMAQSHSPKLNNLKSCPLQKCWPVFAPTTLCHPDLYLKNVPWSQFPVSSPIQANPQETLSHLKDFLQSRPFSASASLTFTPLCLSLSYFQSWQMKRIKSLEGGVGRGGREERDTELIRLEKHAGLNTPNEHYKGFKLCLWGFVRGVKHNTVGEQCSSMCVRICACAYMCVKLTKVR